MPYADPERQRKYQREYAARKRASYLADKVCAKCGSRNRLEVDHVDRSTKVSHKIWTWSRARREAELAKCQVLCHECHAIKTIGELQTKAHGSTMYRNGCRCRTCKDSQRDRARRYRSR